MNEKKLASTIINYSLDVKENEFVSSTYQQSNDFTEHKMYNLIRQNASSSGKISNSTEAFSNLFVTKA